MTLLMLKWLERWSGSSIRGVAWRGSRNECITRYRAERHDGPYGGRRSVSIAERGTASLRQQHAFITAPPLLTEVL